MWKVPYIRTAPYSCCPHLMGLRLYPVGGPSSVTVEAGAVTPDPTPDAMPALAIPDLDGLNPETQGIFSPAMAGNDLTYTAEGANDAKVAVRVSPGAEAIVNIDLGMVDPETGQKVNFSLTDGANLDFQIKKTAYGMAEIVVKEGVTLTAGQYNFQLVVNEFKNAPANTEDVDIEVTVVIDNEPPTFTDPPESGTVAERAMGDVIETFSASDVNNQVLNYDIKAKVDEETGVVDPDAAQILAGLVIDPDTGVLKATATEAEATKVPGDQPDYIEDDPETADVDESEDANEHVFVITVSDGTSSVPHDFTLTVTDVDDPAPGSSQKLKVAENDEGGLDNSFGPAPALDTVGAFSIGQQIDGQGNITLDPDDILFDVDATSGAIYLKASKAGAIDFESGIVTYTLSVNRGVRSGIVVITVTDVNEGPEFSAVDNARTMPIGLYVLESAAVGTVVSIGQDAGNNPTTIPATFTASDEDNADTGNAIVYDLWYDADLTDDDDARDEAYSGAAATVSVSANGTIEVNSILDTDADDAVRSITLTLRAVDADEASTAGTELYSVIDITMTIIDTNVAPVFDDPSRAQTHATVSESAAVGTEVHTYRATDEDGDTVRYRLRDQDDAPFFSVEETTNAAGEAIGVLKTNAGLDYEKNASHTVEIQAYDTDGDTDEIVIEVSVINENDETPMFIHNPLAAISVVENTARGTQLGNSYEANDPDGFDITYSLSGNDGKSFMITGSGVLKTLESLDYDRPVPCSNNVCNIVVEASDGAETLSMAVAITVTPAEDSVSTLNVTKANPVPGTEMGHPMSALAGTKAGSDEYLWNMLDCAEMKALVGSTDDKTYCKMWDDLSAAAKGVVSAALGKAGEESPDDLPAAYGSAPVNFVETEWGNWGTILRIEVTAESPSAACGNGNQCVIIDVNSDSADTSIKLQAYRIGTQENKFVAALMLVELSENATDSTDAGVYQHTDGGVAALKVDEEDEIEVEFGNLRGSIDVENEDPEISNFAPEHEAAFDDADVDYTFTVTDSHSGMPEPEDLPDADGDADYTPVVALISGGQCETHAGTAATVKTDGGTLSMAANLNENESLYCPGTAQDGEYDASSAGFGFAPIRDDRDFDEIDDGFDVETTIVLRENKIFYVTFIACDNAGNCSFYDPDGNEDAEELAEITVDTLDPIFVEARTGLTWDSTDNEYDDNRSFIQIIFDDLTTLNTETVEIDDFVVEGHSIKDVHIFENPDSDDKKDGDWHARYGKADHPNKRGIPRYRDIENSVFVELEDELLADETPDVTIVPNGVEDQAGNEQDDGDHEADDWISPAFTIVSIVSTRETSQDEILAGDDDEVTVVVTTDERLDSTRPTVTVTYVKAPAGSIDTKGTATCDDKGDNDGTRERGEIVSNDNCADSGAATGSNLNNSVEKVSNTEWIVTITEPKATGYYNFRISGKDRSPQENPGSEGVSPDAIVTEFFDADGDVNVDDAIFFEGDINLPKPNVRVSGVSVQDNEADVEFRSPLFVELDFAVNHAICGRNADTDERMSNCTNENSEYAEDNFDDIVVTSFVLDGVDITDSVKTTDNQSFLVSLESISIGDHTAELQAVDQAGNVFEDTLEIDFEVNDRDPFEKRLSPGWNLVSLPGEPADSSIAAVFGPSVEVRTVYSYNPVIPGGWQVAVRETLDSDWQGDLTEITGQHGYWVLSDAIQDWEVSIPRLAGGASGTGTPIQPPVIPMYAGWNLIPVTDVSGNALGTSRSVSAEVYLNSLDDGLDLARVLGYDTIRNEWFTVLDAQMGSPGNLSIGSGYWVFVRAAAALVPGGVASTGGGD